MKNFRKLYYRFLNFFSNINLHSDVGEYQLIDRIIVDNLLKFDDQNPYMSKKYNLINSNISYNINYVNILFWGKNIMINIKTKIRKIYKNIYYVYEGVKLKIYNL